MNRSRAKNGLLKWMRGKADISNHSANSFMRKWYQDYCSKNDIEYYEKIKLNTIGWKIQEIGFDVFTKDMLENPKFNAKIQAFKQRGYRTKSAPKGKNPKRQQSIQIEYPEEFWR